MASLGALVAGLSGGRRAAVVGGALTAVATAPYVRTVAHHRPYGLDATNLGRWVVDSTWSVPNTTAGALFLLHQRMRGNVVRTSRTTGSGTVDLAEAAIAGYATTVGTVIAGSRPRLDAHERVHVTQERLFGPFYGPLVVADYLRLICIPTWWTHHDHDRYPVVDVGTYLRRGVYPRVWHERWAYAVAPVGSRPLTLGGVLRPVVAHLRRRRSEWAQQDSNL
jgi:hypothetical protein